MVDVPVAGLVSGSWSQCGVAYPCVRVQIEGGGKWAPELTTTVPLAAFAKERAGSGSPMTFTVSARHECTGCPVLARPLQSAPPPSLHAPAPPHVLMP